MADATGERKKSPLRVAFDGDIEREFHDARVTSDAGLLAFRALAYNLANFLRCRAMWCTSSRPRCVRR